MDLKLRQARSIQERINLILYEDWDPIGMSGELPLDEYEAYVGGVYPLLAARATPEEVAEYLAQLTRDRFGFEDATAAECMDAARKLCALDVRLTTESS